MGMWEGLYVGMQGIRERRDREMDREEARRVREEDMAFRREQLNLARLDAYRQAVLPTLLQRQEEARAEQRAINNLVTLGFSRPSANALVATGEAPMLLETLKAQDYAPSVIAAYDQQTVSILQDRAEDGDTRAEALLSGVYSGANLANPSEATAAIIEAAFQATNFEDIQSMALRVDPERIDSMAPLGLSFSTASVDTQTTNRLRREITETLGPLFGPDALRIGTDGGLLVNEATAPGLSELISRTLRAAEADLRNPSRDRNLTELDVISKYTTPIMDLRDNRPAATPEQFVEYLPLLAEQGPQVFVETFLRDVPDVSGDDVVTTGGTIDLMTGRGRQPGGVRVPEVTIPEVNPATGFDPSVFDPENLQ
jgi:hypothetical protein